MIQRLILCSCFCLLFAASAQAGTRGDVIEKLNHSPSTEGSDDTKSWRLFFDACLEITPPPAPVSEAFNMNTVWPEMANWSEVAEWSAQNEHMASVFIEYAKRDLTVLPYGSEYVPSN